jgi:[ribosomal protein S5]-alanine N-acetyltransferase
MTSLWQARIPVETPRLVLRALRPADAPLIARYVDDPGVARMLAIVPWPYGERDARAFIAGTLASNAAGRGLGVAVAERTSPDSMIGVVSFAGNLQKVEIGWWFGRPFWGRGFATEAVAALLRIAFVDPRLERIIAGAFHDNPASLKVQEKLGFIRTGESHRHCVARGTLVRHVDTLITRTKFLGAPAGR